MYKTKQQQKNKTNDYFSLAYKKENGKDVTLISVACRGNDADKQSAMKERKTAYTVHYTVCVDFKKHTQWILERKTECKGKWFPFSWILLIKTMSDVDLEIQKTTFEFILLIEDFSEICRHIFKTWAFL